MKGRVDESELEPADRESFDRNREGLRGGREGGRVKESWID